MPLSEGDCLPHPIGCRWFALPFLGFSRMVFQEILLLRPLAPRGSTAYPSPTRKNTKALSMQSSYRLHIKHIHQ